MGRVLKLRRLDRGQNEGWNLQHGSTIQIYDQGMVQFSFLCFCVLLRGRCRPWKCSIGWCSKNPTARKNLTGGSSRPCRGTSIGLLVVPESTSLLLTLTPFFHSVYHTRSILDGVFPVFLFHIGCTIVREENMSDSPSPPSSPSLPWRFGSSLIMGLTGSISRGFLYGLNYMEVIGLDRFLETLDKRKDVDARKRGLITGTV